MLEHGVFSRLARAAGFKEVSKVAKSNPDAVMPKRCLPAPINHAHASDFRLASRPAIDGLLASGGPSDIARSIVTTVVDAIRAVVRAGALSHAGQKGMERILPLITNRDAPSAIVWIAWVLGVVATVNHSLPALVCRRGRASMIGFPVLHFFSCTPTTGRGSPANTGRIHNLGLAAVAGIKPSRLPVSLPAWLNSCKPAMPFTHFERFTHHNAPRFVSGHYASVGG